MKKVKQKQHWSHFWLFCKMPCYKTWHHVWNNDL